MSEFELRRSQLVSPSGVGALVTAVNGVSGVIAGLDHWYESAVGGVVNLSDFELVGEWRLVEDLRTPRFLKPPDYREPEKYLIDEGRPNLGMRVPALRFPLWSYCEFCREMELISSSQPGLRNCPNCQDRREKKKEHAPGYLPKLTQVAFMAMCEDGHLQDFPFAEWVHKDPDFKLTKEHKLKLTVSGGYAIDAQTVSCSCDKDMTRTLGQILNSIPGKAGDVGPRDTYLSKNLSGKGGEPYRCKGVRAWLGEDPWNSNLEFRGVGCGKPIQGGLVSATNAYYPETVSSLYIPENEAAGLPEGLLDLLTVDVRITTYLDMCKEMQTKPNFQWLSSRNWHHALVRYSEDEIVSAMNHLLIDSAMDGGDEKSEKKPFKFDEQKLLSKGIKSEFLRSIPSNLGHYSSPLMSKFSEISLVDRLKETRVFTGFSRVTRKQNEMDFTNMLFKKVPAPHEKWLPAYSVLGEGIYLSLDPSLVHGWAMRDDVQLRYEPLRGTTQYLSRFGGQEPKSLLPRFVLLHSFAHVLINQLVFDCGYSAAALRERIYCFDDPDEISGLLIYTAAGDSDGTMGGLVRMGKPDRFVDAIETAIETASWCSNDPVCIEVPATNYGGRSANLAACHDCSLLPETSCEEYNSFLDRASIVGIIDNPLIGYFND